MKRRLGIIIQFILLFLVSRAQTAQQQAVNKHEFSIQQCIDYGIANNLQVKNALLDVLTH